MSNVLRSIPYPRADLKALLETTLALKETVETMAGMRQNEGRLVRLDEYEDFYKRVYQRIKGIEEQEFTPSLITTRGDLIRGNSAGAAERYALGASGTLLRSNGNDAIWTNITTVLTNILTARGQIIRRGASAPEALAAQTANTFLGGDGTDIGLRNVAQVLTSLGISFGTWTPTFTINANVDAVSANGPGWYAGLGTNATGGVGIGCLDINLDATVAGNLCNFRFTLPATPTTFTASDNATGAGVSTNNVNLRMRALTGGTIMLVQGVTGTTAAISYTCVFMWRL